MPVGRGGIISFLPVILVGLAPVLIYRVTTGAGSPGTIGTVASAQMAAIVWFGARNLAMRYRASLCIAAGAGVAAALFWIGLPARSLGLAVGGVCHAGAYTFLLIWFVSSLRSGREPVVTGFARQMRRTMPPEVVRYTRRVTIAWSGFFAAQLTVSAALLALAPEAVWTSFVNLLNLPLLTAMILAEFGCRMLLFRREQRTGLIGTLAGLRQVRVLPGSRP